MSARPDPATFVVVEQASPGQWLVICPDGIPRERVGYVEAMAGALFWASHGGYGLVCIDMEGARSLVLYVDTPKLVAGQKGVRHDG